MPAQEATRACRKCGVTRVIQQFYRTRRGQESRANVCKWCTREGFGQNFDRLPVKGPEEESVMGELFDLDADDQARERLIMKPYQGGGVRG